MHETVMGRAGAQLIPLFTLVSKALGATSGFIAVINTGGRLEVIHSLGKAPRSGGEFEWNAGICGAALESGEVQHRRAGGGKHAAEAAEAGWEAGIVVALPAKIAGVSPSVMALHLPRVAQLSQGSLSLIKMVAELCDTMVNNSLLTDRIAASQREWQTMIDHLPEGIILLDREFKIKRCNHVFATWNDSTPKDLIGKRCHEVFHRSDGPDPSCPHLGAMLSNKPVTSEFGEGERLFEVTAIPMFDEELNYLYTMELVSDVTERRALQKNLVSTERMAALAQLSGKMAHEINNPLSFILSNTNTLEEHLDDLKRLIVQVEIALTARTTGEWEREKDEMRKVAQEIDLPGIAEDSDRIIAEIKEGSRRIATIVKQLGMFTAKSAVGRSVRRTRMETVADRAIDMIRTTGSTTVKIERAYTATPEVEMDPSGMGHALIEICDYLIKTTADLDHMVFSTQSRDNSVVMQIRCVASGSGSALLQPEGSESLMHNLHLAYGLLQENGCSYDLAKDPNEGPVFTLTAPAIQDGHL